MSRQGRKYLCVDLTQWVNIFFESFEWVDLLNIKKRKKKKNFNIGRAEHSSTSCRNMKQTLAVQFLKRITSPCPFEGGGVGWRYLRGESTWWSLWPGGSSPIPSPLVLRPPKRCLLGSGRALSPLSSLSLNFLKSILSPSSFCSSFLKNGFKFLIHCCL